MVRHDQIKEKSEIGIDPKSKELARCQYSTATAEEET